MTCLVAHRCVLLETHMKCKLQGNVREKRHGSYGGFHMIFISWKITYKFIFLDNYHQFNQI